MVVNDKVYAAPIAGSTSNYIIDPNQIFDQGKKTPRYVPQENLCIYVELEAQSNPKVNFLYQSDGKLVKNIILAGTFYNSTRGQKSSDNSSYFTTSWTEMYDKNRKKDTEGFGIRNIDIEFNASLVPKIHIEFVDVRGKNLLELGNSVDNPYNVFYQMPYPIFHLTIKGYFGQAIKMPLVMEKVITRFDPTSGSYIISADFKSWTFAILNDLILFYAVIVPYMFKVGENEYEGWNLVQDKYKKYNMNNGVPEETAIPLFKVFYIEDKISQIMQEADVASSKERSSRVTEFKEKIKVLQIQLNPESTLITKQGDVDVLVNNTNADLEKLKNQILSIASAEQSTNVFDIVFTVSNEESSDPKVIVYNPDNAPPLKPMSDDDYQKLIKPIDDYESNILKTELANLKSKIESTLNFTPSVSNVIKSVIMHIDAFAELLKRKSEFILSEVYTPIKNSSQHYDYEKLEVSKNNYRVPWPEFYVQTNADGKASKEKEYPGVATDPQILKWGEIVFIDEMFRAAERVKQEIDQYYKETTGGGDVYLSTPLLLGGDDSYQLTKSNFGLEGNDIYNIVNNVIQQILVVVAHNGILYGPIKSSKDKAYHVYSVIIHNMLYQLLDELKTNDKGSILIKKIIEVLKGVPNVEKLKEYAKYKSLYDGDFNIINKESHGKIVNGSGKFSVYPHMVSGEDYDKFKNEYLTADETTVDKCVIGPTNLYYNPKILEKLDIFKYDYETNGSEALTYTNKYLKEMSDPYADDMFICRNIWK